MDDLHKLAQRIADKEFERVAWNKTSEPGEATAVYLAVYRAIMDNAEDIAVVFCDSAPYKVWADAQETAWKHWNEECAENAARVGQAASILLKKNPLDDAAEVDLTDVITMIVANDELHGALEDIITYARRDPENLGDADAILADILERAKEALNG